MSCAVSPQVHCWECLSFPLFQGVPLGFLLHHEKQQREIVEAPDLNSSCYKTAARFSVKQSPLLERTLEGTSCTSMRFCLQSSLAPRATGKAHHCRQKTSLFTMFQGAHIFFYLLIQKKMSCMELIDLFKVA